MTTRNVFIFLGTFVAGALISLVVRAAMYQPPGDLGPHPAGRGEYTPMVSNPLTPSASTTAKATPEVPAATLNPSAEPSHANHVASPTQASTAKPVNTVCAICGMNVDPNLQTLEYQGKTIGFGCKLCAPKFKADPERYGPSYLKNEVGKR